MQIIDPPRARRGGLLHLSFAALLTLAGASLLRTPADAQPACIDPIRSDDGSCIVGIGGAAVPPRPSIDAAPFAQCPAPNDPQVRDILVRSVAVGRDIAVRLILPEGFAAQPTASWPTIYFLTGHGNTYQSWTCSSWLREYLRHAGVIAVMPESVVAYDLWDGEQYPNKVSNGVPTWYSDWQQPAVTYDAQSFQMRFETFDTVELRQLLVRAFRADDARMAIAGLSMGGFGALHYASRAPERWVAAAAYSGVLDTYFSAFYVEDVPVLGAADLVRASIEIKLGTGSADKLWGAAGGSIWQSHNPQQQAWRLANMPLYISVGEGTAAGIDYDLIGFDALEAGAYLATSRFLTALARSDITVEYYPDAGHTWTLWNTTVCRSLKQVLLPALGVSSAVSSALVCPTTPAKAP